MILVPLSWFLFNINNAPLIFTFTMMIYPSWYSSPDFTSVKFTLKINIVLLPDPHPHPEQAPDSLHISSRLWSLLLRLVRRVSNFSGNSRTTVGRTLSLTRCTGTTPTLLRYHHHDEARISLRGEIKSISPILLFLKPKNWNYFRLEHDL